MSKKKKKSSAADNLIESLMDDLKDIRAESSIHSNDMGSFGAPEDEFEGLPTLNDEENRVENTNISNNMWKSLEDSVDAVNAEVVPEISLGGSFPEESDVSAEDFALPQVDENEIFQGPSADFGYQSMDDLEAQMAAKANLDVPAMEPAPLDDSTKPVMAAGGGEDKTVSIQHDFNLSSSMSPGTDVDKTLAVEGFANARLGARHRPEVDVKVSVGQFRGGRGAANVLTSVDASLAQAESLKLAQQRILELEKEVEHLRSENEELASAGEIIRSRADELTVRISSLEKEKLEAQESAHSEILILKGSLQYKESEVAKARIKVEELETRLKSDFKKIRVRERELENRLELLRAEKSALVRSKDEYILEQKRKIDQLSQELDNYRKKCLELNKTIEANQDQFKRTERALRLALNNLESKEENLVPLKKAE